MGCTGVRVVGKGFKKKLNAGEARVWRDGAKRKKDSWTWTSAVIAGVRGYKGAKW